MSDVNLSTVAPLPGIQPQAGKADDPAKIHDAAQQFEAILLEQVLESAHGDGGWLGSGEDSAGSCAGGFAEQQLALSMARQGGFGLADLISKGLQRSR
jgi:Rod binding domain-containing protein